MDHGNGGDMPMTPMPPMTPAPMTPGSGMYNNSMNMSMGDMAMHMSFFWGKDVTVLFQGWPNGHIGMYLLALIFVFFLAAAVELLSVPPSAAGVSAAVTSLTQAAVYALRMALAYMVMLSVMSFNLGIFIVAVAGHAIGYFLVKFRKISAAAGNSTGNGSSDVDPKV